MGMGVMIIGESGSGKSYSMWSLNPKEVGVFAVEKPRLPFPEGKNFQIAKNATYNMIMKAFTAPKLKRYVIDDSQYLLVNEMFDRATETGYGKFTEMALHFRNLIHYVNHNMPDDVIVYFLHHPEIDTNTGKAKAKTIGKMLDEKLTVEGCFDIVLFCKIENGEHVFITQSDGTTTAKSPLGMFPDRMPNDLKQVDEAIRKYYGMNEEDNND